MKPNPFLILFVFAALFGLVFTGFSTSDFVEHLDRQVHAIHCSFIPGIAAADVSGASGCHTALMSPYSSILRGWVWGGLPMALLGMGTFAFLLFRGVEMLVNRRNKDFGGAVFLLAFSLIPVLTSLVMGGIAVFVLGEICKVCAGIYLSSFLSFGFAAGAVWWSRRAEPYTGTLETSVVSEPAASQGLIGHAVGAAEALGFVLVPALFYLALVPDHGKFAGTCGALPKPDGQASVFVPLDPHPGKAVTIEVFDPLCPACRGFEERLLASGLAEELDRKAVLFPLDSTCNWMVGDSLHPGACTVSEAVLCAGNEPQPVIDWAFAHQEEVIAASKADPAAAASMVKTAFPALASCVGGNEVRQRLNRALRWTVANQLPVLTPQLYVNNKKLCDEDTDLGMDFALAKLLDVDALVEASP